MSCFKYISTDQYKIYYTRYLSYRGILTLVGALYKVNYTNSFIQVFSPNIKKILVKVFVE